MRVKRGAVRKNRRRKILKQAKGYYGLKSKGHRIAMQAVDRSGVFAYRDRRQKKRQMRGLWIVRINAAARENGLSYSRLIAGLKAAGNELDRKVLADLAVRDAAGFASLAAVAKQALDEAGDRVAGDKTAAGDTAKPAPKASSKAADEAAPASDAAAE
jgi:large subunit ribosomal protein L20